MRVKRPLPIVPKKGVNIQIYNSYYLPFVYEETEIRIGSTTCSQIFKMTAKQEDLPVTKAHRFHIKSFRICSYKNTETKS